MSKKALAILTFLALSISCLGQEMDRMWGESVGRAGIEGSDRVALFRDGNYGMFIHWGLYSHLGGQWKGQTFYGIAEWMKRQMDIPTEEYMALAGEFNPVDFDGQAIARLARDAGMKWIIITAKHHEGFAMFKSAHPFNIVDATPYGRDPIRELADACREHGLGFGFYYSHNQDWTAPGGGRGPKTNPDGSPASFEQYFREKCLPQVREICTGYGPLSFVWFDTPGGIPKTVAEELAAYVREVQPSALLCSRVGHGLGDYASKGDMEVPPRNLQGLWETCDTSNDSWAYAWYDENWKDTREIVLRVVSTIARGGTYLYNVGPDGRGRVPESAATYLRTSGEWIRRYPQAIYSAGASPWGHALPWGDVTTQGNTLNLVVFDWPQDGQLLLPGLQSRIESVTLLAGEEVLPIEWTREGSWTTLQVPPAPVDHPASVIQMTLADGAGTDQTLGIYPNIESTMLVEFADVTHADKRNIKWMEKFGEWKHMNQVSQWQDGGRAVWAVNVAEPGDYTVGLTYKGEGRLVWQIETSEGARIQNQQTSASVYHRYPIGLLHFGEAGEHTITVSLVDGDRGEASLSALHIRPVR